MNHPNVFASFFIGDYTGFEPRPATGPTRALPGSGDKLKTMAGRVERGEECFHPDDGPEDED